MKNAITWKECIVWKQGKVAIIAVFIAACMIYLKVTLSKSWEVDQVQASCALLGIAMCAGFAYARLTRSRALQKKRRDEVVNSLGCLCSAIDARDSGRPDRLKNITQCALWLGKRFRLGEEQLEELQLSVYLHDIGKLAIPEHILHKPGPLSEAEWETVRSHPNWAAQVLSKGAMAIGVINTIRHHHERWDGRGYPDGLRGEGIPLAARILGISEACEALRSKRPYRLAWNGEEFMEILKHARGTQFDPGLVEELMSHFNTAENVDEAFEDLFSETTPPLEMAILNEDAWLRVSEAGGETATLLRVSDSMSRAPGSNEMLQCAIAEIKNLASYSTLACYVLDAESGHIKARFVDGENSAAFKTVSIPYGQGATGWAIANHRAVMISQAEIDFSAENRGIAAKYGSVAVFPLIPAGMEYQDENFLGALTLYLNAGVRLNAEVQRRIQELTLRVGQCLSQRALQKKAQSLSLSDPVTNLPNMRFLYAHAAQELAKARRHTYPMSIVEMEIQNLQELSEEYGQEVMEKMLRELASTLHRQLRNSDVMARLSSNEFAAVLSMTSPSQARFLIRRLADAAGQFRFQTGPDTLAEVKVNFGCATYPENGRTAESLFLHANRDRTQSLKQGKAVWPVSVRQVRGNVIPFHMQ